MTYLVDDVWCIVKEFMLDWKGSWYKNMNLVFDDIKCHYPNTLVVEGYSMKTRLYYTTFLVHLGTFEERFCNQYDIKENEWINGFIPPLVV